MDIRQLEQMLAENLDSPSFWAVYADALLTQDPASVTAHAVRAELAGQRCARGAAQQGDPAVEWSMGHWRALHLGPTDGEELLDRPAARFLRHLVLPVERQAPLGRSPPTVQRLDLVGQGQIEALEAAPALQELQAADVEVNQLGPLPSLRRLELFALARAPGALPRLERLILGSLEGSLESLLPERLPALHTLVIRHPLRPGQLGELLSAPIARQLRRLEVQGVIAWEEAQSQPSLWSQLEALVVDDGFRDDPVGRLIPRWALRDTRLVYVQLVEPGGRLLQEATLEAVCDEMGLGRGPSTFCEDWLRVPSAWAGQIAARMAARSGCTARLAYLPRYWKLHGDHGPRGFESERQGSCLSGPDRVPSHPTMYLSPQDARASHSPAQIRRVMRSGTALSLPSGALEAILPQLYTEAAHEDGPPDLSRWTERLLRRHGLVREPVDPAHPYWRDWDDNTRPERSRAHPEGRLSTLKLFSPGRWGLTAGEGLRLAEIFRRSEGYPREVVELLESGEVELLVW